jgi:hypothetical protein
MNIIRISNPCAENWAAMSTTSDGRHCAACQKTVIDFTAKTDAEILAYFKQQTGNKTCGRFQRGQLNRSLATAAPQALASRWQLWLASWLVAALTVQSCQPIPGEQPPLTTQSSPPELDSVGVVPVARDTSRALICGKILNTASRLPVAGATVSLKNTTLRATTDAAGYFTLPESEQVDLSQTLMLELKAPGYPVCSQVVFPASSAPAGSLVAVLTTFPLPSMVLGEIELPR